PHRSIWRDLNISLAQYGKIDLRFSGQYTERSQKRYADRYTTDSKPPCKRKTVTAIVALAADDANPEPSQTVKKSFHLSHKSSGRVLHENGAGDTEFLDRPLVDISHLL